MKVSSKILLLANVVTVFALPQHADHAPAPTAPMPAKGGNAPKAAPATAPKMAKGAAAPKAKAKPKTVEEAAPIIKAANRISQKPVLRESATRELVRFGPFTLPPMNVRIVLWHVQFDTDIS
jgi:hypothetical protein